MRSILALTIVLGLTAPALAEEGMVFPKKATVTLSLQQADVDKVLKTLARKGGLDVVVDDSVSGKLTLDLTDVSLDRAFELVLKAKHLTYEKDGETLIVRKKV